MDNPTMIRPRHRHLAPAASETLLVRSWRRFCMEKYTTFRASAIPQNVTKCWACHEKSHSNFTKYSACHAKWISWLIRVTYETSFTMRGATRVPPTAPNTPPATQNESHHIDPRDIWNVIYNARSKQSHPSASPNTAPATKSLISGNSLKRFRQ